MERVVLNALANKRGFAAGYLRAPRNTSHRLQPPTPSLRRAEGEAYPPAESLSGHLLVRRTQRPRRLGRAAAAHSTGLRRIHFIHFIESAVNAGLTILEGLRHDYKFVMLGKHKVLLGKRIRFARLTSTPRGV